MARPTESASLDALRSWRASLIASPAEAAFLTDETLARYLRARGTVAAASDALRKSLLWRAENCTAAPACATCEGNWGAHCFLGIGWTASGFPIVYGSVPRAASYEPVAAVAHFAQSLEKVFTHPSSGPRFVWLFDMAGYTFRHAMLVRVALGYAMTFSRHYPERLEAVCLLNPPAVWDVALSLVRPFLDARTLAKVRPVHAQGPDALAAALAGLGLGLQPDTLAWVADTQRGAPVPLSLPLPMPPGTEGLRLVEPSAAGSPGGPPAGPAAAGGAAAASSCAASEPASSSS